MPPEIAPGATLDAFCVAGFGVAVGVRVADPALVPLLRMGIPQGLELSNAEPAVVVDIGAEAGADPAELLEDFDSQLRFAVAQFSRDKVFIHAGVVAWKGKAVVFPARSHSGKTHLVATLLRAGADYISDEHAILDGEGLVHPWFKPLSVREAGSHRQRDVAPTSFGAKVVTSPLPVAMVLSTRFEPGAAWNPVRLPTAQGALELMANAVAAQVHPEAVMEMVANTARRAAIFKTARPDAAEAAPLILHMLEDGDTAR